VIRLACVLALIALAIVIVVAAHPYGFTATLFSFVGIPALAAAMALYGCARWRAGAFRPDVPHRPGP
jgi:hypothetical protein